MTNKKPIALNNQKGSLKTLMDLGLPRLTPEEQAKFEAERVRVGKAQAEAWRKWNDDEIVRFLDAFKIQFPASYSNYIQQEKDIDTKKIDSIDMELALEMQRFSKLLFADVTPIDRTHLFISIRRYVRVCSIYRVRSFSEDRFRVG